MGIKYEDVRGLGPPGAIWDPSRSRSEQIKLMAWPAQSLTVTPRDNLPAIGNTALSILNKEQDRRKIRILKSIKQSELGVGKASKENKLTHREQMAEVARELGLGASGNKAALKKAIEAELDKYNLLEK